MKSLQRLQDKVAVVTGSSRGIGKAVALEFARRGACVVVTFNSREQEAAEVAREVEVAGGKALMQHLDVCERSSVRRVFSAAAGHFGRIDVLVNNAGFLQQKPFHEITDDDWDFHLDVNLKGVFVCSQEIVRFFEGGGSIVNIASVGGQTGGNKAPHYAAAKAGVISLTKSTARILSGSSVRVNAVAPGFIRTDIYEDIVSRSSEEEIMSNILLRRIGEPEDVAAAAVFLASDEASYITGHVLNVNGGLFLGSGS